MQSLSWSPRQFAQVFPFHLVFDAETHVRQLGPSLQRLLPAISVGQPLSRSFRIKRPRMELDYASVVENRQSLFLLECLGTDVVLKGQMLPMEGEDRIAFLCSPWVTDLKSLKGMGISLSDFAVHDPISDYLLLLQAKDTTLAESTRLQEELSAHRETLELEVQQRTQQLLREVEERERLEERYLQGQRMDALGKLAGGVAHDFNNLLQVILTSAGFVKDGLALDDPRREDILEVLEAGQRAAVLTRQLLTFSRRQPVKSEVFDVNDVIRGIHKMLRRLLGSDIDLSTLLADEPCHVCLDKNQFEQVIMNMAVNARDAMPNGGKLAFEVATSREGASFGCDASPRTAGGCVRIRVQDTGTGMSRDIQQHIFEPFYTTKRQGEGIGLGLATSYGVIAEAGGEIRVRSEVGQGTIFDIFIPRAVEETVPTQSGSDDARPSLGTGELILVVEDEPGVRRVACRVLRGHGYEVLTADNGRSALALPETQLRSVRLLLTDMVMPKMGGAELAERLVESHPGMKVVFMTGYQKGEARIAGNSDTLHKPFTVEELLDAVAKHMPVQA